MPLPAAAIARWPGIATFAVAADAASAFFDAADCARIASYADATLGDFTGTQ